jgi:hypothetical protein
LSSSQQFFYLSSYESVHEAAGDITSPNRGAPVADCGPSVDPEDIANETPVRIAVATISIVEIPDGEYVRVGG